MDNLAPLEELAKKCRLPVQEHVSEAISCYKAGLFRACIVATWHALFFDFIYKLEELKLIGDKDATRLFDKFIQTNSKKDVLEATRFESGILDQMCETFELITPLEKVELERLQVDRHRCAHPSMHSLDEPYSPTPELARTHLRHCVEIMFQREPLQGQSAKTHYFNKIKSKYFPIDVSDAKKYLKPFLKNPKEVLLKSLIVGLTKAYLNEHPSDKFELRRIRVALEAIVELHPENSRIIIMNKFPELANAVPDETLYRTIILISKVKLFFEASSCLLPKLIRLVESIVPQDDNFTTIIAHALAVDGLAEKASITLKEASQDQMVKLVASNPSQKLTERAVDIFKNAGSFASAENIENKIILPLIDFFSALDIKAIIHHIQSNNQIYCANGTQEFICALFESTNIHKEELAESWLSLYEFLTKLYGTDRCYLNFLDKVQKNVLPYTLPKSASSV